MYNNLYETSPCVSYKDGYSNYTEIFTCVPKMTAVATLVNTVTKL